MDGFKGPVGSPHPRHRGRNPEEVSNAGREHSEHPMSEMDADWRDYIRGSATSEPFRLPLGVEFVPIPNLPGSTNFDDHKRRGEDPNA
ncbi:MAG TPA: hypothetical protein VJJ78_04645 [Candidatus Saccharimonadales bacterium]|nr:hypothetical protein [Candidatus Saccharimonadales bacterium]